MANPEKKTVLLRTSCAVLAAVILLCAAFSPHADAASTAEYYENAVIFWTNIERERHGLAALKTTDALLDASETRAKEIMSSFSHNRPSGKKCYTALTEQGVSYGLAGENIAAGHETPFEVVNSWMESDGHRENILDSRFSYMGAGYYYNSGSRYKSHWEQMFVGNSSYSNARSTFYVAPTGLSLDKTSLSLAVGKNAVVEGTPSPVYATEKIVCTSSDPSVVAVTGYQVNNVTVKGMANGRATLTFRCGNYSRSISVTVGTGTGSGGSTVQFGDVPKTSPFYSAISWAVKEGIAAGYGDGTFRPNQTCTKAQAITFLWRASGSPSVNVSNPFSDVSSSSAYYKAIMWAYSKGIAGAEYGSSFAPNRTCTRVDIVTYIWRSFGKPYGGAASFSDTGSLSSDELRAVRWAASAGVTEGYDDGTFRPDASCTRAHVVTFLYRAF